MTSDIGDQAPATDPVANSGIAKKKQLPLWQETILLLVFALGLSVLIKALLLQAFYIPSESMEPGLINNDRILVQKVSYWGGGAPERGDVVVFQDPGDWLGGTLVGPSNPVAKVMSKVGLYPSGGHLVKRVIGVEGDVITCCDKQGRISVNGVPLDEDVYVKATGEGCNGPMVFQCAKDWTAGPVPKGNIFVMGDNRANSADSSEHMCKPNATQCVPGDEFVSADLVVGKVFALVWPRNRMGWIRQAGSFSDVPDAK